MNEADKKAFEEWYKSIGEDGVRLDGYDAWQAALEYARQPAEPRYWVHNFGAEDGGEEFYDHPTGSDCPDCIPLYTTPQPATLSRLTTTQIRDLADLYGVDLCRAATINFIDAIMDAMQAKAQLMLNVQKLVEAAILDAQLRCIEKGKIDTPDEIQQASKAALAKHSKPTQLGDYQHPDKSR